MIRRGWKHCAYPINTHMVLVVRPQIIAKLQFIWIRKVLFHFKIPLSPKFPDYPPRMQTYDCKNQRYCISASLRILTYHKDIGMANMELRNLQGRASCPPVERKYNSRAF